MIKVIKKIINYIMMIYVTFGFLVFLLSKFEETKQTSFYIRHLFYGLFNAGSIPKAGFHWSDVTAATQLSAPLYAFMLHEFFFYIWLLTCVIVLFRIQWMFLKKYF